MVSLASSVHAGPSTFALMLGSGISAGSGVFSGWEMTVDLIRRLAVLQGQDPGDDPVSWYRERSGGEPDYSDVLAELAPSQGDRRNLLSSYFEPTEQERDEGLKVPTKAHHAIAQLVADGFVKVIVTTNFDRLLEAALTNAGAEPSVVSSPSSAAGVLPITHSPCTIIKVHGDYLSPDLKNTHEELASYDSAIDRLLDEVFDQYGLIVCGWSGTWDTALRNAILRTPNRRFATYWLHRGNVSPDAQEIIRHRDAISITIQDADSAMDDLVEKVQALASATDQRPADTTVAIAHLKRYLPDPVHRIRLHDLVMGEVAAVIEQVQGLPTNGQFTPEGYAERMEFYERAMSTLMALLANGAFFSDRVEHDRLWVRCTELLATRPQEQAGVDVLVAMQQYPTLLALYALALGALAADRVDSIARVLTDITVQKGSEPVPVAVAATSWHVLQHDPVKQSLDGFKDHKTPVSDHLCDLMGPAMSGMVGDQQRFEDLFDEVEYLLGVAYTVHGPGTGPVGRAAWRTANSNRGPGNLTRRHAQALVAAGLFNSDEHLTQMLQTYDADLHSRGGL